MDSQLLINHHILERLTGIECLLSQVHYKIFEVQLHGIDTYTAETKPDNFYNLSASANSGVIQLSSSQKRRMRHKRAQKAKSSSLDSVVNVVNATPTQPIIVDDADVSLVVDVAIAESSSHASGDNVANTTSIQPPLTEEMMDSGCIQFNSLVQQQQNSAEGNSCRAFGGSTFHCSPNVARRGHFAPRRRTRLADNTQDIVVGRSTCTTCANSIFGTCFCDGVDWPQCEQCTAAEYTLLMKECHASLSEDEMEPDQCDMGSEDVSDSEPGQCGICGFEYLEHGFNLLHLSGLEPICECCYGDEFGDCEAFDA